MSNRSSRPSLGDYIAHEARHAIHDIRQKLFEEAWFGRVVTAEPVMEVRETDADRLQNVTLAELWGGRVTAERPVEIREAVAERPQNATLAELWGLALESRQVQEAERNKEHDAPELDR